jgi:hypothetical protein
MPSSRAGYLDPAGNYLVLELLDALVGAVGNQLLVAIVVDISDTTFSQSE